MTAGSTTAPAVPATTTAPSAALTMAAEMTTGSTTAPAEASKMAAAMMAASTN